MDALIACGWPGERIVAKSGASRVYVALSTLRKLGLRDLLLSRDDGYLLDAQVGVGFADLRLSPRTGDR